jgi:hypothetical protein
MTLVRIPVDLTWAGASGSPGVNIWHGRLESLTPGPNEIQSLTDILEDFYTTIRPLLYVDVTISYAGEGQGVGDDIGNTYNSPAWTMTGSGNQGYAPPANCMLAQWSAQTGGRSGRGRTFIGPLDLATLEPNGTPVEAKRTVLQGAMDDLIESSDSIGNGALGIYSRAEGIFRDFVTADVANYFAVLRSRRD